MTEQFKIQVNPLPLGMGFTPYIDKMEEFMQKKNKIISIIIAVALMAVLSLTMPVFAAGDTAMITVGKVTGEKGATIYVPIDISGQPNIAGYEMTITFDKTKLEYKNFTVDEDLFPKPSGTNAVKANTDGEIYFMWINLDGKLTDKEVPDGTLLTLEFTVLADLGASELGIEDVKLLQADDTEVYITAITISGTEVQTGERLSLPVDISGQPNIAGYEMTITFDKTKLKYEGFTANEDLFPPPANTDTTPANENGKIKFIGANLDIGRGELINKEVPDGTLFTLEFTVLADSCVADLGIENVKLLQANGNKAALIIIQVFEESKEITIDGESLEVVISPEEQKIGKSIEALKKLLNQEELKIWDKTSNEDTSSERLGTGMYIKVGDDFTHVIIVYGDVTGNGIIDKDDFDAVKNNITSGSTDEMDEAVFKKAGKTTAGGKMDIEDLMSIRTIISSKID
jgi:hypothetical protein